MPLLHRPKVGLALSSGSARGLAHIGVLKCLLSHNIPVDMIAGTSMGSFIGAAYALGRLDQVEAKAKSIDMKTLTRLVDPIIPREGLIKGEKVKQLFYDILGDAKFSDLDIPLAVVTTDLSQGREKVITEGKIIDAVRASISIPNLFLPVISGDSILVDGGITNPLPVSVLLDMGADVTIGVDVISRSKLTLSVHEHRNLFNIAMVSVGIMEKEVMEKRLITNHPDIRISPKISDLNHVDFHKADTFIKQGIDATEEKIQQIKRLLGNP